MPDQVRRQSPRQRDTLQFSPALEESVAKTKSRRERTSDWPPVPDLFDVITYFRARGDSYTLIANIGFRVGENPSRTLTARGLQRWYEAELDRRAAARAAIR